MTTTATDGTTASVACLRTDTSRWRAARFAATSAAGFPELKGMGRTHWSYDRTDTLAQSCRTDGSPESPERTTGHRLTGSFAILRVWRSNARIRRAKQRLPQVAETTPEQPPSGLTQLRCLQPRFASGPLTVEEALLLSSAKQSRRTAGRALATAPSVKPAMDGDA